MWWEGRRERSGGGRRGPAGRRRCARLGGRGLLDRFGIAAGEQNRARLTDAAGDADALHSLVDIRSCRHGGQALTRRKFATASQYLISTVRGKVNCPGSYYGACLWGRHDRRLGDYRRHITRR